MESKTITVEQIDELLQFLPLFEQPDRKFIERWDGGDRKSDGSITLPYPIYAPEVEDFFHLAGQSWRCDYRYNLSEANIVLKDDARINTADLDQIQTIFTYCV